MKQIFDRGVAAGAKTEHRPQFGPVFLFPLQSGETRPSPARAPFLHSLVEMQLRSGMIRTPRYCRPAAYDLFAAAAANLDATENLVRAALAVSMHELGTFDPSAIESQLAALATQVRARAPSGRPAGLLAHLHSLLFDELGLRGNTEDYYHPQNSYLPRVLESRRGLPVLLALIYKSVAEQAGLKAYGLNTPGHFLVAVDGDQERMVVDPFAGGRTLNREEMVEWIGQWTGAIPWHLDSPLPIATHRQWIARIVLNLVGTFGREGPEQHFYAMQELLELLGDQEQ